MRSQENVKVAVVGATGAVGKELLKILEQRAFPLLDLVLFASSRSEGKPVLWKGETYFCQALKKGCFEGIQIAFFDASDAVSREWVPQAAETGAWVVDNSGAFRLDDDILLLVPEVNGAQLESRFQLKSPQSLTARERVITGPNCVAVPLVMALHPIRERWGIRRVVVSTYQSTSGAGASAMQELSTQSDQVLHQKPLEGKIFPHRIAFNCIPHIGGFKEDGQTSEELKIIAETRKILGMPGLKISATAVRVPTFSCHGESVNIECERPFPLEEVRSALRDQPGVILQDDPAKNVYPLGITSHGDTVEGATGQDAVFVGRIRRDPSVENGLNLWVVSDNLRKGAALNAVQLGEVLLKSLR